MKKSLVAVIMSLVFVLVGCGAKTEKATFTQEPLQGAVSSITVEYEGDKVTGVSAKIVMDNEKLQIDDEAMAKQMAEGFDGLKDSKVKYSEKETVITYTAPKDTVKDGESFKEAQKNLETLGYTKEK